MLPFMVEAADVMAVALFVLCAWRFTPGRRQAIGWRLRPVHVRSVRTASWET